MSSEIFKPEFQVDGFNFDSSFCNSDSSASPTFGQGRHLALESSIAEVELILLREIGLLHSFLAGEVVSEFAETRGVAGASDAIRGGLLQRIESAGKSALRLPGDGGLVCGAEAGIVRDALKLRSDEIGQRLLLAQQLLVERVGLVQLLIG